MTVRARRGLVSRASIVLIGLAAAGCWAQLFDQGMVLFSHADESNVYLKYLSSDTNVKLSSGAYGGSFSPDFTRVAAIDRFEVAVMNIDGTGRQVVATHVDIKGDAYWAKNGYIYYSPYHRTDGRSIYRVRPDGTGDELLFKTFDEARGISIDDSSKYLCAFGFRNRDRDPEHPFSPLATGIYDLATGAELFRGGGCQATITHSSEEFTFYCHAAGWGLPTGYGGHQLACTFSTATFELMPVEDQFIFTEANANGNFICQDNDDVMGAFDGESQRGFLFNRRTGEHIWFTENWPPRDAVLREVFLDQDIPSVALSRDEIKFTVREDGTMGTSTIDVSVVNERGGALDPVTISSFDDAPLPPWLSISIEGTGNSQSLVNTIIVDSLPTDTVSFTHRIKVSSANATNSSHYDVFVTVGSLLGGIYIHDKGADSDGFAWSVYEGVTAIPDSVPEQEAASEGYGFDFDNVLDSSDGTSYVRVTGYIQMELANVYQFDIDYAGDAQLKIRDSIVASTFGAIDTNQLGLKAGWFTFEFDYIGDGQMAPPVITVTSLAAQTHPLSEPLLHVPFDWEDTLYLTTPIGGEQYQVGDTLTVAWAGDHIATSVLVVSLSLDEGESWHQISVGAAIPTDEWHLKWVIPPTLGGAPVTSGQCLARVMDYLDNSTQAVSPQAFGIGAAPVARRLLAPNAGGYTYAIRDAGITVSGLRCGTRNRVTLTTMQGRTLFSVRGTTVAYIPVENLAAGLYVISIVQGSRSDNFVVMHKR